MQPIPASELLKTIPEFFGIRVNEQPQYALLDETGIVQIRLYPSHTRAQITLPQMEFDQFRTLAFERLSSFIFGHNETGEKIPMTAPVLIQRTWEIEELRSSPSSIFQDPMRPQFGQWTMSFILPHKKNPGNTPAPKDCDIRIVDIEPRMIAALEYSGNNTKHRIDHYEKEFQFWLKRHPDVTAFGEWIIAQYDAPFVIPALKRNELQVELVGAMNS